MRGTLVVLLSLPGLASAAGREPPFSRIQDAVMRKAYAVASTSHLSLSVGGGFGQEYTRDLQFGLSYRYHLTDYLGVGVTFVGGLPFETGLVGNIQELVRAGRVPQSALDNVRPEAMRAAGTVDVHLVPIYGKFVLFGRYAVHYDLSFVVGFGAAVVSGVSLGGQSPGVATPGTHGEFTPSFGAGVRILIGQRVGITLDFRDYLWSERNAITGASSYGNHLVLLVGPALRF